MPSTKALRRVCVCERERGDRGGQGLGERESERVSESESACAYYFFH
jgi:hypothetical protein